MRDIYRVSFPFPTKALDILFTFAPGSVVPKKALILCLGKDRKIPGLSWSDQLACNFIYVPVPPFGERTSEVSLTLDGSMGDIPLRLLPWGSKAQGVSHMLHGVTVSSMGVLGEEMREYRVSYELPAHVLLSEASAE